MHTEHALPARPAADPAPGTRRPFWRFFLFVYLAFVLTVGSLNASYLFHAEMHEVGDVAANSLAVREAKHFQRLTGQYSRWGFSHPGPGLFYVMAAGEALFYDGLHLTVTPVNAQILAILLFNVWFVAASLAILARERGGWLGVALCLGVLIAHLATLGPAPLLSIWTPHMMMLPFACLLVAAASVGSGRGQDLPILAVAGAALLNSHVAQPLFVGPLCVLAYAGLWRQAEGPPWKMFPRAHVLSGGVLLLTALPVGLDLLQGARSNFHLILDHLRVHAGEKHPWGTAFAYCLRFLTYKPSVSNEAALGYDPSWADTGRYVLRHGRILVVWTVAAGLMFWRLRGARFRAHLAASIVLAGVLSIYWGHIQDGELFYFNSWFFYGILLALAFAAALGVVTVLEESFPRAARSRALRAVAAACVLAALVLARGRLQLPVEPNEDATDVYTSVQSALRVDDGAGKVRFLAFAHDQWGEAVGVALQLARRNQPFRVERSWSLIFGQRNVLAADEPQEGQVEKMRVWHIVPRVLDPAADRFPLPEDTGISLTPPPVNPAAGIAVTFCGTEPNAARFMVVGWSVPGRNEPYSWTEQSEGILRFQAVPVPAAATVEISVDAFPALTPGRIDQQRTSLFLNGTLLGEWRTNQDAPMTVAVPAAQWNARPDALLVWRFPDAASPRQLGRGADDRKIAFGFRRVVFTLKPPGN